VKSLPKDYLWKIFFDEVGLFKKSFKVEFIVCALFSGIIVVKWREKGKQP